MDYLQWYSCLRLILQRFSRAGPRGRGREWAILGVHPLPWLLSNNRLEMVPIVSVPHTSSSRLLLSNKDKGCTPSVAHSLPLPLGPALLNLSSVFSFPEALNINTWGCHSNDKMGYQARPWTYKKHPKHVFPRLKFASLNNIPDTLNKYFSFIQP